jgi:hypothetical protein
MASNIMTDWKCPTLNLTQQYLNLGHGMLKILITENTGCKAINRRGSGACQNYDYK